MSTLLHLYNSNSVHLRQVFVWGCEQACNQAHEFVEQVWALDLCPHLAPKEIEDHAVCYCICFMLVLNDNKTTVEHTPFVDMRQLLRNSQCIYTKSKSLHQDNKYHKYHFIDYIITQLVYQAWLT